MNSIEETLSANAEVSADPSRKIEDRGWVLYMVPSIMGAVVFLIARLFGRHASGSIWVIFSISLPIGLAISLACYWIGKRCADSLPPGAFWVVAVSGGFLWSTIQIFVGLIIILIVLILASPEHSGVRLFIVFYDFVLPRIFKYILLSSTFTVPIHFSYMLARRKKALLLTRSA